MDRVQRVSHRGTSVAMSLGMDNATDDSVATQTTTSTISEVEKLRLDLAASKAENEKLRCNQLIVLVPSSALL